jgi:hypothetical protein
VWGSEGVVTVVVLAFLGGWNCALTWWAASERSWHFTIGFGACAVACLGLCALHGGGAS